MEQTKLLKHIIRPLFLTLVIGIIIVGGVFLFFQSEESSRDEGPRVVIEKGTFPDGWQTYAHPSYAVAYPADIVARYEDTFDILSFYVSTHAAEPVARIFPSRSIEDELVQLKKITGSRVSTSDVYGEVIRLTRIALNVPNDGGGEDLIEYYMFRDALNEKTYTFKMSKEASWAEFEDVVQTIRTP